jgi:hypothetical protein
MSEINATKGHIEQIILESGELQKEHIIAKIVETRDEPKVMVGGIVGVGHFGEKHKN